MTATDDFIRELRARLSDETLDMKFQGEGNKPDSLEYLHPSNQPITLDPTTLKLVLRVVSAAQVEALHPKCSRAVRESTAALEAHLKERGK